MKGSIRAEPKGREASPGNELGCSMDFLNHCIEIHTGYKMKLIKSGILSGFYGSLSALSCICRISLALLRCRK